MSTIQQILMAVPNPTMDSLKAAISDNCYIAWVTVEENDHVYCVRWGEKRVLDGGGQVMIHKG
jgi:hypothetical protein